MHYQCIGISLMHCPSLVCVCVGGGGPEGEVRMDVNEELKLF